MRIILTIGVIVLAGLPLAAQENCAVTQPDASGWYGNSSLRVHLSGKAWTSLPRWDAAAMEKNLDIAPGSLPWRRIPGFQASYRQVITWTWDGYDVKAAPQPAMEVSGRRLDANSPPMLASHPTYGNGIPAMGNSPALVTSGGFFPTTGCWEVTGKRDGHSVSFVVYIGESDRGLTK